MVPLFHNIVTVIAIVGRRPGIGRRSCGSDDVLVNVVIRIIIAVIYTCVVVEVVVAAKISSSAGVFDTVPKRIALGRKIIEAIVMPSSKGLFVAGDEDMRFGIYRQLVIQPLLVDLMVKIMPDTGIFIKHDDKGVFVRNRIRHKLLICRAVVGQLLFGIRVAAEDVKPAQHIIIIRVGACTWMRIVTPYIAKLMIATADIDGDTGIVNRFHYFYPGS
ncbi:hypothetical protein ES703_79768 [subsurface metagenome]